MSDLCPGSGGHGLVITPNGSPVVVCPVCDRAFVVSSARPTVQEVPEHEQVIDLTEQDRVILERGLALAVATHLTAGHEHQAAQTQALLDFLHDAGRITTTGGVTATVAA